MESNPSNSDEDDEVGETATASTVAHQSLHATGNANNGRFLTPNETALISRAKRRRKNTFVRTSRAVQPTIKACFGPPSEWPEHTNVSVVDLFCCIGGFSTGCAAAGHRLVLAVDNDPAALGAHAANHPSCRHELMELGPDTEARLLEIMREVLPKSIDGSKFLPWHLHGSPPCQKLCSLRRTRFPNASVEERQESFQEGMSMVLWYLKLVETCFATMNLTSWSFEEAPNPQLVKRMEVLKRSRSVWFDFEVVEFWKFGVPQTRKRTIGGNPWLIDRLRHDGTLKEWRVIRDVLTPPENAVSLRSVWSADRDEALDVIDEDTGETLNPNNEKRTRLLHELSFTVMGGHSDMYWHDSHINRIRKLSIEERKRLQTFPPDYILPSLNSDQVMGVGNAIPPLFAQKFMSGYRPA
jgi:site-specific DNA-cytosine methylase